MAAVSTAKPMAHEAPRVEIDPRAARAHGLHERLRLPVGAVVVLLDGVTVRVRPDGGLDVWPPNGFTSIAADPTATCRRATP